MWVGYAYHHGEGVEKNFVSAMEFYSRAAAIGHPRGLYNLGVMSRDDPTLIANGTNHKIAMQWWEKASNGKHASINATLLCTNVCEYRSIECCIDSGSC
jgi:TPR repeat protein